MSEEVVFARKTTSTVHTSKVIAEISMLRGPVNPLMSSQVFECDESFATDGADLSSRAMPASVVTLDMSAKCVY